MALTILSYIIGAFGFILAMLSWQMGVGLGAIGLGFGIIAKGKHKSAWGGIIFSSASIVLGLFTCYWYYLALWNANH